MPTRVALSQRAPRLFALLVALVLGLSLCCPGSALAKDSENAQGDSSKTTLPADSAGTVLSFDKSLHDDAVKGDLFWFSSSLAMKSTQIHNDLIGAGLRINISDSTIDDDVRVAGSTVAFSNVKVGGFLNVAARTISIDRDTQAVGMYGLGSEITYEGTCDCLVLYGQEIVIDGTVNGNVIVSAQNLTIGKNAKITGTLEVHSGQSPQIPETAQIGSIDTTHSKQNNIDRFGQGLMELRSFIAPLFQVGGFFFVLVSCGLMGLIIDVFFGAKLAETTRMARRHPAKYLLYGVAAMILLPLLIALSAALVFFLPLAFVLFFLAIVVSIVAVPFTGASLALTLRKKIERPLWLTLIGSAVFGGLLFVPILGPIVFLFSVIYFLGYVAMTVHAGHDDAYHESFHHQERIEAKREEKPAPTKPAVGFMGRPAPESTSPQPATAEEVIPAKTPEAPAAEKTVSSKEPEAPAAQETVVASEPAEEPAAAEQVEAAPDTEQENFDDESTDGK